MIDAIGTAQIAMRQDQSRLETINQNISNMQTPGYKRQVFDLQRFGEPNRAEQIAQVMTQGSLVQTKDEKDLAIADDGFLTVQTPEGIFYTRRGDLHINERGELCSATDALILGQSGVIRVDDNPFTIDSQGVVYIENRRVDQLKLVAFKQMKDLKYEGQGLFSSAEVPLPARGIRILQGQIEQSNVTSVDEMLEMIKVSRHFEASQRVMQRADQLLSTAINQLGEGNV